MRNLTFEWDEYNEDKLVERHGVMPEEAEECFFNRHVIKKAGKNIYYLYGQTDAGRYLFLVYELKSKSTVRIYSGRNMTTDERGKFKRKK
jgi:uncharacterized DUF497 family protein